MMDRWVLPGDGRRWGRVLRSLLRCASRGAKAGTSYGHEIMHRCLLLCALPVLLCTGGLVASAADPDGTLSARLSRLEAQSEALRAELQWLRQHPPRLPETTTASLSAPAAARPAQEGDYFTWPELQAEMRRLAWSKGDFRVVPYGYLWGNMVYETARTAPIARSYTTWVESLDTQGEDAFTVDGRTTRLGLEVSGPRLWLFNNAQSGGRIEVDFQGDFNSTENKGGLLLRHAYVEVKDDYFRLLAGQTWDIISPLIPGTIMYTIFWDAGNVGYRRGQLRLERYLAFSDTFLLTVQGSLNQNIFSDSRGDPTVRAETDSWPVVEGRLGATLGPRGPDGLPIVFGVSGHIGNQGGDILPPDPVPQDDVRRRTWSLNADVRIPVSRWLGFQGEFYTGENMGTFLGGIGQGVNRDTLRSIRSTGGWFEVWYYWFADLHSHVGYCVDDPVDRDLTLAAQRIYNQVYFGNIVYDVTDRFELGLEVQSWRTLFVDQRPGESVRLEFMARYGF